MVLNLEMYEMISKRHSIMKCKKLFRFTISIIWYFALCISNANAKLIFLKYFLKIKYLSTKSKYIFMDFRYFSREVEYEYNAKANFIVWMTFRPYSFISKLINKGHARVEDRLCLMSFSCSSMNQNGIFVVLV